MSTALVAAASPLQRFGLLECSLSAAAVRCSAHNTSLPQDVVSFCQAAATGAVMLGSASEVLVPASLVHAMETSRTAPLPTASSSRLVEWQTLLDELRLVVLVGDEGVESMLTHYPQYTQLCVPVPGGHLVARKSFGDSLDSFYNVRAARLQSMMAAAGPKVRWRAWMRSALTCPYEGTYVPPIRVSDLTARLLRAEGGCDGVVWEAATAGLTPRWLETALKTALSCGLPTSTLSLALCADADAAARLMSKAVEMGVCQFATNTLQQSAPMWNDASVNGGGPLSLATAMQFAVGWADVQGDLSVEEEELLESCESFEKALCASWEKILKSQKSALHQEY